MIEWVIDYRSISTPQTVHKQCTNGWAGYFDSRQNDNAWLSGKEFQLAGILEKNCKFCKADVLVQSEITQNYSKETPLLWNCVWSVYPWEGLEQIGPIN